MKTLLLTVVAMLMLGCGSGNFDAVSGNATLENGTVNGTISVQTPLGTFTFPGPAGSPSPATSPGPAVGASPEPAPSPAGSPSAEGGAGAVPGPPGPPIGEPTGLWFPAGGADLAHRPGTVGG